MEGREDLLTLLTWWKGDPLPDSPRIAGFGVKRSCDDVELALLQGSFEGVIAARRGAGNIAYVARLRGEPVAFAWVAQKCGHIGCLGLSFAVGEDECYVWDLTALEAGRPMAADSHLLRAIIEREKAQRVWTAVPCDRVHEVEAAGFTAVAELYRQDGEARLEATGEGRRLVEAADFLGLAAPSTRRGGARAATAA